MSSGKNYDDGIDGQERRHAYYWVAGCCSLIGLILTLVLVPLSFSKVEYYEAGLVRQRSTNKVDKDKVYTAGNYYIGPDYSFETFQISAVKFDQRLSVWSRSSGDDAGSSLYIDCSFQYELRKDDLGKLYSRVATNFKSIVSTNAVDAIKNTAPLFGIDEYLNSRERIERIFAQNVSHAIDDIFADLVALQLRDVIPTDEYQKTRLEAAIQEETNLKEAYVQEAVLVRETTDVEVKKIENEARAVEANAEARATLIVGTAEAQSVFIVDDATSHGLATLFTGLNLTTAEDRATLDYLTALLSTTDKTKYYIGFQPTLTAPVTA